MHIVSWNVNGLPTTLKEASYHHGSVENYFAQVLKADIVCFQEAKVREDRLEKWLACVPGYESFWAFSQNKKGYSGVVTYVKEGFSPLDAAADCLPGGGGGGEDDITQEGRVMMTDHGAFVLFNIYVPNAGEKPLRPRLDFKMKFLNALRAKCDELVASGRHVIVVGDLNVSHTTADIHSCFGLHKVYAPEELAWTDSFLSEYVDAWRHLHPDVSDGFTCWNQKKSARLFNEGARIDFTVCDKGFKGQLVGAEILDTPDKWSDHTAVSLTLKDQPPPPPHPPVALSSKRIRQFQEDRGQSKLTALFSKRKVGVRGGEKYSRTEEAEPPSKKGRGSPLKKDDGEELEHLKSGRAKALEKTVGEGGPVEEIEASGKEIPESGVEPEHAVGLREEEGTCAMPSGAPLQETPAGNVNGGMHRESSQLATGDGDVVHVFERTGGLGTVDSESAGTLNGGGVDPVSAQDGKGLPARSRRRASETESPGGSKALSGFPSKTLVGKKRGRNRTGKPQKPDTRTQLKLSNFFAKKER
ncbi:putative endonuclease/exonuclease/phosphatase family protein [Klebsormidium nitens]|uniref:DNA-(apurinic or apyrimidinic site) endonuclease n=1 Tax=Klebsormidium nitens TaxID=105231 RepID=A0A1Y1HQ62_KLENI|nr:putative endonuclease/exonuclease/phosphatase family protein [Klebsormidium nitens]|eukprot:GAQ78726.1 putative endonuclease/exonuclease/phosphatase family protein [Klebsormidium nitens]